MSTSKALIRVSQANTNGQSLIPPDPIPAKNGGPTAHRNGSSPTPPPQLTDEVVDGILKGRGLRGWLLAAKVTKVLGLLSLYLFLDGYDVRAVFNRRVAENALESARAKGRRALL